jgi:transposase
VGGDQGGVGPVGDDIGDVRRWVRQAQIDTGQADGVTSESAREIRELKRKNAKLERTIEILKEATSFFAWASDPRQR